MNKMIYPNGAYVRYVWGTNSLSSREFVPSTEPVTAGDTPLPCELIYDTPVVVQRFVSFDGQTEVEEQDFSYSTVWAVWPDPANVEMQDWTSKQTTVVTKDLVAGTSFTTVYTYVPRPNGAKISKMEGKINLYSTSPVEQTVQQFDANGRLLRTVNKQYVFSALFPPLNETVTLENGQTSQTHRCFLYQPCAPGQLPPPGQVLGDLVTDSFEYDFGPGTPGPLLRHTHIDYNLFKNPVFPDVYAGRTPSTYLAIPNTNIIYDGSNNRIAEADYRYDESSTSPVTASGHDETNYSATAAVARQNQTSVTRKCFNTSTGTSCPDSITTYSYDETGQVVSKTDPVGNVIGFSYVDSFSDTSPGANTNAYPTQITLPQTNGLSHIQRFSYAYSDGQMTLSTDQNGQNTSYFYRDPFRRLTETDAPDGGNTKISYNDSGARPSVVTTRTITAGSSSVSTAVMDGMGHVLEAQANSDPAGIDYVDTKLDGLGRPITVSNPHRSAPLPTDGITTTQYDALGRVTQVTRPDGSVGTMSYTGNCTVTIDEAGKRHRGCSDALGRLIEVDEPTPGISETTPASVAVGTVTVSGSLQSKQLSNPATGSVSIFGTDSIVPGTSSYDFGTVTVSVGSGSVSTSYGNSGTSPSSASSVAAALCSAINATSSTSALVSCASSGAVLNLTARTAGSAGNGIPLGVSAQTSFPQSNQSAFSSSSTSGTLSGGGATVYDSATTTITVSGHGNATRWSGSGTTPTGIALSLATAINSDPYAYVSASASGGAVSLTSKIIGLGGNLSLSCSSGYDSVNFTAPSFTTSCPPTLSGGREAGALSAPMLTLYSYDALGNLRQVTQQGGTTDQTQWRTRTFSYDSLSRLLTATNPESGTISYAYDAAGNLLRKTSPQPNQTGTAMQTISYCYDQLNRVTGKAYATQSCTSGNLPTGTAAVSYVYDQGTNAIGRLSGVTDQAGSGSYSYDVLGRVTAEERTITGITKRMSYTYNLDGSVATAKYPSGAVITYTPDPGGRVGMVQDIGNNINYVVGPGGLGTLASYGPDSSLTGFLSGASASFAGIANSFSFNNRLQPLNMAAVVPTLLAPGTAATASVTIAGNLQETIASGGTPHNAASGSPLSSVVMPDGTARTFYFDSNQHICQLSWSTASAWANDDITAINGNIPAGSGSGLTTVVMKDGSLHVFYVGSNQHVYHLYWNGTSGWGNQDLTAITGNTLLAASGSAISSTILGDGSSAGTVHAFYFGPNQHMYHLYWSSAVGWSNQDLTAITGNTLVAPGSDIAALLLSNNSLNIYYVDTNQDINSIYWSSAAGWGNADLTTITGNHRAGSGTRLATIAPATGSIMAQVFYEGSNQHIYDTNYSSSLPGWQTQDLTGATDNTLAVPNSRLTASIASGSWYVGYVGALNQHVYTLYCCAPGWGNTDLNGSAGSTVTAGSGSGQASVGSANNLYVHEFYLAGNQHVYDLYYNSSLPGWQSADLTGTSKNAQLDSGIVSISVGGFSATACFGPSTNPSCSAQQSYDSASNVAGALAQGLNIAGSPATATANGTVINLVWKTGGNVTAPVSALTTTHDQPSIFPNPSFTSPATSFSGGAPGSNMTVFSLNYDLHLTNGDNGNVYGITNNRDTTRNQTFEYDSLNRLISAQNAGTDCTQTALNGKTKFWGNSYDYDAWGNLLHKNVTKCSAEYLNATADVENRIHVVAPDYQYDAAGNMWSDSTDGISLIYDAENRIASVTQGGTATAYVYDADGNRAKKSNSTNGTLYWYMLPGIVAESDLSGNLKSEYIFFDGERVARKDYPSGTVAYYFSDRLKTASVITDATGAIKADSDYYPWGGELQFVANDSNHYKFTGKERDNETGLDYFGARYYSNGLGRFLTPDWAAKATAVPYAEFSDPQSLNLYAYVRNIPTTRFDVDGHCYDPMCLIDFAKWFAKAAQRDGGVKPAANNTGIGVAKGAGQVGVALVMAAANQLSPGLGNSLLTTKTGMKAGLAVMPSNQTQAEAVPAGHMIATTAITMGATGAIGVLEGAGSATSSELGSLTSGQARAIQNFATKYDTTVDVVGSRAAGTATAESDFDYVIGSVSKVRSAARSELPRGQAGGEIDNNGVESGIDVFNGNKTPTDTSKPNIRFEPKKDN